MHRLRRRKTLLQINAEEIRKRYGMKVIVDLTPKTHPELAGEGIEYTWETPKYTSEESQLVKE